MPAGAAGINTRARPVRFVSLSSIVYSMKIFVFVLLVVAAIAIGMIAGSPDPNARVRRQVAEVHYRCFDAIYAPSGYCNGVACIRQYQNESMLGYCCPDDNDK